MKILIDDNLIFYGSEETKAPKKKKEDRIKLVKPGETEPAEVCCALECSTMTPSAA